MMGLLNEDDQLSSWGYICLLWSTYSCTTLEYFSCGKLDTLIGAIINADALVFYDAITIHFEQIAFKCQQIYRLE